MTAKERIKAILAGEKVDRPAASAWKHFYLEDRHPVDFVKRTAGFQEENDWDFIKVSYNGYIVPESFGATIEWSKDSDTFPTMIKHPINCPLDYANLKEVSVIEGPFAREVEATKKLVEHFKGDVPIVATIFSPLTALQEMSCGWLNPHPIISTLRHYPNDLHKGLEVMTSQLIKVCKELIKAGIDGIFFATHLATTDLLTVKEYEEFGMKYDLQILEAIKDETWFNILHVHGVSGLMMEELNHYPVQAINWEDVRSNVSFSDARKYSDKLFIGGLEQIGDFYEGDRDALKALMKQRIEKAMKDAGDKVAIAPGCCMPTDVPEYRFTVIKEAVEEMAGC